MNRVLELTACNLLGKFAGLPLTYAVALSTGSFIWSVATLLVFSVAINWAFHRTFFTVDPEFYWTHRERLCGYAVLSYITFMLLMALHLYLQNHH